MSDMTGTAEQEDTVKKTFSKRSKILIIDDDETVCALVRSIMEPRYTVIESFSGKEGVKAAQEIRPDLIMLDIHLADGNGFAVMREIRENEDTFEIPVLMITGDNDTETEENGFRKGASDFIRKPFVPEVLLQRSKRIINLYHYQKSIEDEVERQTRLSKRLTREMMLALSKAVDTKDHYTVGHSRRVAALCAEMGRRLGKNDLEQIKLYEIGLLHDIGKIGIHEDIIHKNTRLSDDEFATVKSHTTKGYDILKEITDMPKLCEGARWHHERYDGSGYPDGLKGEEIPEAARIACIADCYDAMTSTRTYSVPKRQEDVRAEIERCRGIWFDPQIAGVMLAMIDEDKNYRMNENATGGDVWKEYDRLWESVNRVDSENATRENGFEVEVRTVEAGAGNSAAVVEKSAGTGAGNSAAAVEKSARTVSGNNAAAVEKSTETVSGNSTAAGKNTETAAGTDKAPANGQLPAASQGKAATNVPQPAASEDEPEVLPERIRDLTDVDTAAGLKNCGSVKGYLSVLDVFHRTAAAKADEIESMFRNGDITGYTNMVHALKSSARIIGATALSRLAEELENAGKNQNRGFISEHTEVLLQMYRGLNEALSKPDPDDKTMPEIAPSALKEAYRTIAEIAQSMDYELMDELIGSLRAYRIPIDEEPHLAGIESMMTQLDWDGIRKAAEDALNG